MVAFAAMTTLLVAGCGGDGDDSNTTTGERSQPPPSEVQAGIRTFGSEASGSQATQAEAAVRRFLDAEAAEEWEQACSYMAKQVRRLIESLASQKSDGSCPGFLQTSVEKLPQAERSQLGDIKTDSVRVKDKSGFVIYTTKGGEERALSVRLESGNWKVAGAGPTPLN